MLKTKNIFLAASLLTLICSSVYAADKTTPAPEQIRPECVERMDREDCGQHGKHHVKDKEAMQKKHAELAKMTPEERQKAMEKMKAERLEMREKSMAKLTPEQRKEVEKFIEDGQAHRKSMKERYEKMSPEQKEALRYSKKASHGHKHFRGEKDRSNMPQQNADK